VHEAVPPAPDPFIDLIPPQGVKLTPRHYAYLKISEGCDHKCRFCIIPSMRGKLASRPAGAVLREAEKLVAAGVKELLVISQDTSAYGRDLRHAESFLARRGPSAPTSPIWRANWAHSGPGCGCTTSTPTRMSTS
jgi:ribosomal protein S12 methylthiotransferase